MSTHLVDPYQPRHAAQALPGVPLSRRRGIVVAVVATALLVASVPATAGPAGARTVTPASTPERSTVRCAVLETFPSGIVRGCTDGSVRFEPRRRTR